MNILALIGFLVIFVYTVYIIYKTKDIPVSLSCSVYDLNIKNRWIFTIVMWIVGFMISPCLFAVASESTKILAFFTIGGLIGVGVDPLVKGEKNLVHYISAIICGISSQILLFLDIPLVLLLWGLYIPYTLIWEFSGKNMFFAELIMIIQIMLMCLLLF